MFRRKCQCILLSHEGTPIEELCELFGVRRQSIYNWFNLWECEGAEGLKLKPGRGRPAKLKADNPRKTTSRQESFGKPFSISSEIMTPSFVSTFQRTFYCELIFVQALTTFIYIPPSTLLAYASTYLVPGKRGGQCFLSQFRYARLVYKQLLRSSSFRGGNRNEIQPGGKPSDIQPQ